MHSLEVIHRILRTRVNATVEEHEQIMAAFNEIVKELKSREEVPMPGKVAPDRPPS